VESETTTLPVIITARAFARYAGANSEATGTPPRPVRVLRTARLWQSTLLSKKAGRKKAVVERERKRQEYLRLSRVLEVQ
jgi:hypothetical protein